MIDTHYIYNKVAMTVAGVALLSVLSANAGHIVASAAVSNDSSAVAKSDSMPESSVIDEVVWVVGDEPILKSDVEAMRLQSEAEGVKWDGDPDYVIPEQIAIQKLFLHQAALDSIEVTESEISQGIDQQIDYLTQMIGSREKLEEYYKKSVSQIREEMHDEYKNRQLVQEMKKKLVSDIKVSPADVRAYFRNLPEDSIPFVPTAVEVEIIVSEPKPTQEEINRVKNQLREYTDRINKGETTFATLARFYSEDGSARQGGELGYTPRAMLDPAFASVAFNLTDPRKVSKIVESEFGYHIIQLIDRRGDEINVRHILLKPKVSQEAIDSCANRLDSIAADIRDNKFTFEEAASVLSDDKDTRMNHGLMSYFDQNNQLYVSRMQMKELPTEVARVVDTMKVGEISRAFEMINKRGKTVTAIVKLKDRIDGHRATITEDFQVMKDVVVAKKQEKKLNDWVADKIKHTYVRMADRYKNGKYQYQGWVK